MSDISVFVYVYYLFVLCGTIAGPLSNNSLQLHTPYEALCWVGRLFALIYIYFQFVQIVENFLLYVYTLFIIVL